MRKTGEEKANNRVIKVTGEATVGAKPDGFSWTGFVTSASDGNGGYALLFRECSDEQSFSFDLSQYFSASRVALLSGGGSARLDKQTLVVEVPKKLGYLWLKIDGGGN